MLRNHGQDGVHRFRPPRGRATTAASTRSWPPSRLHRLPDLPDAAGAAGQIADYYTERFAPLADRGVLAPPAGRDGRCYYVYSLLAAAAGRTCGAHLTERCVGHSRLLPGAAARQPAFAPYASPGARWPRAEQAARRHLAIPVHHLLTDAQVEHIADAVCAIATERS